MVANDIEKASACAIDLALKVLETSRPTRRTYKTDRDFATNTDFNIEQQVRELLADLTPEIGFQGEENGRRDGQTELTWCLDPIDGTTNYARGLPNYAVSLALLDTDQPIHGEVALPRHNERYATVRGRAYLNGEPIHISDTQHLREAVVSLGDFATGLDSAQKNKERVRTVAELADTVARVRMLGSAAADFAWLAAGRIDAVIMHSNHPWDVAAGIAICRAAGATVVGNATGTPYHIDMPRVLAFSPALGPALLSIPGI